MKVNKENNRKMIMVNIINITLTFLISITGVTKISLDSISYYTLHIATEVTYILLLIYLISILQYANEKISIQTPFSIYLGLEIVKFIGGILFTPSMITLFAGLGILNICITVYLLISIFKIQNGELLLSYKIFGITVLLTMAIKILLPFIVVISMHILPSRYFGFIDIIQAVAILYIIRNVRNLLTTHYTTELKTDI